MAAGKHRAQLMGTDISFQAELPRGVSLPAARRLTFTGVIVLGAVCDLLQVVALLSGAQLSDREHSPPMSRKGAKCLTFFTAVILREGLDGWL